DLNDLYDLSGIIFEASGGIDKNNILEWSKTGVDILSLGSLTHSPQAVNLSLEFS
ncbi:carboxylating.nicotinate-nucleotide diphosphorylase, partial [Candidatus Gottesmanbacteria bacterium]|nr:carboxylating.nicotinate-nucleotide diphosphorylase [Candidatus Gottesmanbacteria bacterium]